MDFVTWVLSRYDALMAEAERESIKRDAVLRRFPERAAVEKTTREPVARRAAA